MRVHRDAKRWKKGVRVCLAVNRVIRLNVHERLTSVKAIKAALTPQIDASASRHVVFRYDFRSPDREDRIRLKDRNIRVLVVVERERKRDNYGK